MRVTHKRRNVCDRMYLFFLSSQQLRSVVISAISLRMPVHITCLLSRPLLCRIFFCWFLSLTILFFIMYSITRPNRRLVFVILASFVNRRIRMNTDINTHRSMHTHTYTHIHTYIHTYIQTHTCTYIHTFTHTQMYKM